MSEAPRYRDVVADMADKAMPIYTALDWKWSRNSTRELTPVTAARLALAIDRLIREVKDSGTTRLESGGIVIERADPDDPNHITVSISRIIGHWDFTPDNGDDGQA